MRPIEKESLLEAKDSFLKARWESTGYTRSFLELIKDYSSLEKLYSLSHYKFRLVKGLMLGKRIGQLTINPTGYNMNYYTN